MKTSMKANFEKAKVFAVNMLNHEMPAHLIYHDLAHTLQDVLPACQAFAAFSGLNESDTLVLETAALFHDLGYAQKGQGHEQISSDIARATLPQFGYTTENIAKITNAIMATQMPQAPTCAVGALLADADLAGLGQTCFFEKSAALRWELKAQGRVFTDAAWYNNQLNFLQNHAYFTPVAQAFCGEGKARNVQKIQAIIAKQSLPLASV